MIKCWVLAPRGLFHPVLPFRSDKKLLFPLCCLCAKLQQAECDHCDEERAWIGTFCTPEVEKALEVGYRVLQIFEVWHYEKEAKFDGKDPDSGLFSRYVQTFMKLKQQADGWPSWVQTEADKETYVRDYEEREGIRLDPERVERNDGLRAVAKLMLNSL